MSSWYRPGHRHYGRKPHTRRARGLKRTDFGKHRKPKFVDITMPSRVTEKMLAIYFKIYSIYCRAYEKYMSDDMAMYTTLKYSKDANKSVRRVQNAIRKVEEFKTLNNL